MCARVGERESARARERGCGFMCVFRMDGVSVAETDGVQVCVREGERESE